MDAIPIRNYKFQKSDYLFRKKCDFFVIIQPLLYVRKMN